MLAWAIESIAGFATVVRCSSVYATEAWGKTDQPQFLNQVIEVDTKLDPHALLDKILATEKILGRSRKERWGPRTIDIDILLYGNHVLNTPSLRVPHPELQNRKFTLAPLREIAPDLVHPTLNKTVAELDDTCPDPLKATKVED